MEKDIIGALALATVAVLIANQLARLLQAMMLHRTVREALQRGSTIGPELLARIEEPKSGGDDRTGMLLIAVGAAMIVFGLLQGGPEAQHDLAPASVFPLFVGAVLVGRHYLIRGRGTGR